MSESIHVHRFSRVKWRVKCCNMIFDSHSFEYNPKCRCMWMKWEKYWIVYYGDDDNVKCWKTIYNHVSQIYCSFWRLLTTLVTWIAERLFHFQLLTNIFKWNNFHNSLTLSTLWRPSQQFFPRSRMQLWSLSLFSWAWFSCFYVIIVLRSLWR